MTDGRTDKKKQGVESRSTRFREKGDFIAQVNESKN